MWTPHDISVMIHHYVSPEAWPLGTTPAYATSLERLERHEMLEVSNLSNVTSTPKGEAFIGMLCNTPVPVMKFIDPRFEKDV